MHAGKMTSLPHWEIY